MTNSNPSMTCNQQACRVRWACEQAIRYITAYGLDRTEEQQEARREIVTALELALERPLKE
jgi:hypothetical protein